MTLYSCVLPKLYFFTIQAIVSTMSSQQMLIYSDPSLLLVQWQKAQVSALILLKVSMRGGQWTNTAQYWRQENVTLKFWYTKKQFHT